MQYTYFKKSLVSALGLLLIIASFIPHVFAKNEGTIMRVAAEMAAVLNNGKGIFYDSRYILHQINDPILVEALIKSGIISPDAVAIEAHDKGKCASLSCRFAIGPPENKKYATSKELYFDENRPPEELARLMKVRKRIYPNAKAYAFNDVSWCKDHKRDVAVEREHYGIATKEANKAKEERAQSDRRLAQVKEIHGIVTDLKEEYDARLAELTKPIFEKYENNVSEIIAAARKNKKS